MLPTGPAALRGSRKTDRHSSLSVQLTLPVFFFFCTVAFELHLQVSNSVPVEQVGFDVLSEDLFCPYLFPVLSRSSLEYLSFKRRIFLM